MVSEVALALPVLSAVAEPIAESIQLFPEVLEMLAAKGVDLSASPDIAVAYHQSLQFFSPEAAATLVRAKLAGYHFPTGRETQLTEKQKEALRWRLHVLIYKDIAARMGMSSKGAYLQVNTALPLLEPGTIQRLERIERLLTRLPVSEEEEKIVTLHQQGLSLRRIAEMVRRDKDTVSKVIHKAFPDQHFPTNKPDRTRTKKVAAAFWEEWAKVPLPASSGVIKKNARAFGITARLAALDLKREGIDLAGEVKKKRLLFLLEVEKAMRAGEALDVTRNRLRVSRRTISVYRRHLRERAHLKWATELARESKVDWWWEDKSGMRVNMGLRNREVLKEMESFKPNPNLLRVKKIKMWFVRHNNLVRERQFRKKSRLPLIDIL